ncbi:hypothetical protein [Spongiactinospora sp. TRM90649]|uniref:hypothetical protein n=1 Tax=Spongiactinospora sp. TRM90649 TaxID=3031114 RepID=UPI0023F6B38A|nr:hypothetical protein [Spongiactinospora sp. TRM90649]MDF5757184.1 hypothetical protein [Spongiactinospora sp. TRM90649]
MKHTTDSRIFKIVASTVFAIGGVTAGAAFAVTPAAADIVVVATPSPLPTGPTLSPSDGTPWG